MYTATNPESLKQPQSKASWIIRCGKTRITQFSHTPCTHHAHTRHATAIQKLPSRVQSAEAISYTVLHSWTTCYLIKTNSDHHCRLTVTIDRVAERLARGQGVYYCSRAFSSRYHNSVTAILVYKLYSMLLTVCVISIENTTGKCLYSCFNLCSNGILSDSRSIISISLI